MVCSVHVSAIEAAEEEWEYAPDGVEVAARLVGARDGQDEAGRLQFRELECGDAGAREDHDERGRQPVR